MYQALHQYLLQYRQLALPGIGSFTLEQQPARLDFANKTLHGPTPSVVFSLENHSVRKHFFQYLSNCFHYNETEAIRHFNDFTFDLKSTIANNGSVSLPGIGTLTKSAAETYSFEPFATLQNYFPDLVAECVLRENTEHMVRVGEDEITSTQVHEMLAEQPAPDRWWIAAAILAAIGIGAIVYYHLTSR